LARRLADIGSMTRYLRQRHPMYPLFAFGHGTEALTICFHAVLHPDELHGVIGEAVSLDPPWKLAISRRYRWLAPALLSPRMALTRADRRLRKAARGLSLPLLLLHGSEDTMAPPSGSEYLHRYVGSQDKTLLVFEGSDHDLVNGPGHARVRDKTSQWIEGQLAPGNRQCIGIEYINE
jgi:pimeloyl-ACP methyl ester carboxylesterase